jgi:hypothetical protein
VSVELQILSWVQPYFFKQFVGIPFMNSARQQAHRGRSTHLASKRGTPPRERTGPESIREPVLAAQNLLGNQGVLQRLEAGLRMNDINDPAEREADRVAQAVLTMKHGDTAAPPASRSSAPVLQRKCTSCEEEEDETRLIQREASSASPVTAIPAIVGRVLESPGRPLDTAARSFMEPRFRRDFSGVRVHDDAEAVTSARSINAKAYAVGNDLVFASRNYSPDTSEGKWILAHELAHVIQQGRGGPVSSFNPGGQLERYAEKAAGGLLGKEVAIEVGGASAIGLARLPTDADMPILLTEDQDASKFSSDQRQQMMGIIDKRLQYLDSRAKDTSQPTITIKIPGLTGPSVESERATLLEWRRKLESGTGILIAVGATRNSPAPTSNRSSVTPSGLASTTPPASRVHGTHATPTGFAAPDKSQPHTLEETLAAANKDPHKKPAADFSTQLQVPPLSPADLSSLYGSASPTSDTKPSNVNRAHTTPPGVATPKPQPHTLEETLAAANKDPHKKPAVDFSTHQQLAPLSPETLKNVKEADEARRRGEVTLPDGTTVVIPPKPSGEITVDMKHENYVLAPANVQGVRAMVVRNLNAELRAIEIGADASSDAAWQFLTDWPIMRRLADWASSAEPPPASIWSNAYKGIADSREALRQGNLERAVELTKSAKAALRNAQWQWGYYKDRNLQGAEDIKSGAETTRDAAKYTLMGLAIVASGGTALAVATAGGIAIDLADVASRAALGEKINWADVTAEVAIQVITTKFGGRLSSGLFQAAEKKAAARGLNLTRKLLTDAVQSVVAGAESRTLAASLRAAYEKAANDRREMTVDQFIDQVTDPKSVLIDLVIGVGRGLLTKPAVSAAKAATEKASPSTKQSSRSTPDTVNPETKNAEVIDLAEVREKVARDKEAARAREVGKKGERGRRKKVAAGAENDPTVAAFSDEDIEESLADASRTHRGDERTFDPEDFGAENIRKRPNVGTYEYNPWHGDSRLLGQRLRESGWPKPGEGYQAHHIVPSNEPPAQRLRDFLRDRGFEDINHPDNGVWLPTGSQTGNVGAEFKHEFTFNDPAFRNEYFTRLEEILMSDSKISRATIHLKLRSIRTYLKKGELPPPNI